MSWYQEPERFERHVVSGTGSTHPPRGIRNPVFSTTHVVSGTIGDVVLGTPPTWFLEPNLVVSGTPILQNACKSNGLRAEKWA